MTLRLPLLLLLASSCRSNVTTIPTYWDPEWGPPRRLPPPQEVAPPVEIADVPPSAPTTKRQRAKEEACTAIYVVTSEKVLHAYRPDTNRFLKRGVLNCPGVSLSTPFSMAVSTDGVARVLYSNYRLYDVSLLDASCSTTRYYPYQRPGFRFFGMGYARPVTKVTGDESLYVVDISTTFSAPSQGLARIDMPSGKLSFLTPFPKAPSFNIELTPAEDGSLYGLFMGRPQKGSTLARIDPATGALSHEQQLDLGDDSSSMALAWWRGGFYIFTGQSNRGTTVHFYDPSTKRTEIRNRFPQTVVGASVSTCAPAEKESDRPPKN